MSESYLSKATERMRLHKLEEHILEVEHVDSVHSLAVAQTAACCKPMEPATAPAPHNCMNWGIQWGDLSRLPDVQAALLWQCHEGTNNARAKMLQNPYCGQV